MMSICTQSPEITDFISENKKQTKVSTNNKATFQPVNLRLKGGLVSEDLRFQRTPRCQNVF